MADPVSLLAVTSLVATATGAGVSAYGAEKTGQAQSAMYNYQAGVANVNATVAAQDATYATAAGETEAQQSGMKTGFEVGQEKVGQAAGNLDTGSGSALRVRGSQIEVGQENQGIIRANAAKRAYGFGVSGAEDVAQGGAYVASASNSRTAGNIGATSSIIGGVGQVSSKWLQASQSFGPSSSSPYGQQFGANNTYSPDYS